MLENTKTNNLIKEAKTIYVVGHKNPDGDSIGSCFAMYFALKQLGKDVFVLLGKHSDMFDFLPFINQAKQQIEHDTIDLLIVLDCSTLERAGISEEDKKKIKQVLRIDHHKEQGIENEFNIIDTNSPATCQIVYEFLNCLNVTIDQNIATYLYTGILTDTGSFNYPSTTQRTMQIASELIATGIDFPHICKKLNDTMKESKLKLIATAIHNMEVYQGGKVRYTYIDLATLEKLGIDEEDAEGMTNYLRKVEGTEVAIYVRGKPDGTNKVSLRSGEEVDVSMVAAYFGGGGHKRAAGYTMNKVLEVAKKELLEKVEKEIAKVGV